MYIHVPSQCQIIVDNEYFVTVLFCFGKFCMTLYGIAGNIGGRELNLVIKPQIAIARILVDLNLAVRYGIAICIHVSRKFWRILIWRL